MTGGSERESVSSGMGGPGWRGGCLDRENRSIARAIQTEDEKALVNAIQELEGWSEGITENRRTWAQAVWHAAHETQRVGATASAAFHAFGPELLAQLAAPRPRPMSEVVILGAQHEHNLGQRAIEYDQPRTVRIKVLLEDYTDTHGRTERRLAAYELADNNQPVQRLGYLPKDAPRRTGNYLATLGRPAGKKRIEGTLSPLRPDMTLAVTQSGVRIIRKPRNK